MQYDIGFYELAYNELKRQRRKNEKFQEYGIEEYWEGI